MCTFLCGNQKIWWHHEIPKKFTWKDGKTDLSSVFTQYNCGCCWVVAATQAINDCIVCNKLLQLKKNPNIHPTNLLTCLKSKKNAKCKGGNSLDALQYVEKKGIQLKDFNYDWCSKNKKCSKPSPPAPPVPMFVLNENVPKKCPKAKSIKFYVQNIKQFIVPLKEQKNKKKLQNCIERVKEHILNNGPVVAGYMVYANFLKGNFLRKGNSHAIYFDQYDYEKDEYQNPVLVKGPDGTISVGIENKNKDTREAICWNCQAHMLYKLGTNKVRCYNCHEINDTKLNNNEIK